MSREDATHKINADNQLCLASASSFHFNSGARSGVGLRALWNWRLRGLILLLLAAISALLSVARRSRRGSLAVDLLRRVAGGLGCGVYGWWWHGTVWAALMLLLRGT